MIRKTLLVTFEVKVEAVNQAALEEAVREAESGAYSVCAGSYSVRRKAPAVSVREERKPKRKAVKL